MVSSTESKNSSDGDEKIPGAEAIVLDRSARFLDICIKPSDLARLNLQQTFRVDFSRSNMSYTRMTNGLQALLRPAKKDNPAMLPNRLRDLLIYSYPNSITRLALSPGGLKLALPLLPDTPATSSSHTDFITSESIILSAGAVVDTISVGPAGSEPMSNTVEFPLASAASAATELSSDKVAGSPPAAEAAKPPSIPEPIFLTHEWMRSLANLAPDEATDEELISEINDDAGKLLFRITFFVFNYFYFLLVPTAMLTF